MVLDYLDNDNQDREMFEDISNNLPKKLNSKEFALVLDKLSDDNYIQKIVMTSAGKPINNWTYNISFQGRLFLDNTLYPWRRHPYSQMRGMQRIKAIWTVAKTIIITLNAFAILWLMYNANLASDMTSAYEEEINDKSVIIEQLEAEISVLKADTTSGEKEKTTANTRYKNRGAE